MADLDAIHDLLLRQGTQLAAVAARLDHIEADLSVVRDGYVQQGLVLGQLHTSCCARERLCSARLKRISDEIGGLQDDTGALKISDVERRTKWGLIAKIAAGAVAAAGATVALLQALR